MLLHRDSTYVIGTTYAYFVAMNAQEYKVDEKVCIQRVNGENGNHKYLCLQKSTSSLELEQHSL